MCGLYRLTRERLRKGGEKFKSTDLERKDLELALDRKRSGERTVEMRKCMSTMKVNGSVRFNCY